MTSPYVQASADSDRTEQQVRDAKVIPLPVAVDVLTPLLDAMTAAREAHSEAQKRCNRLTSTDDPNERIASDIARRIAYEAMDAAEAEYNSAIRDHVARLREARNA